MTTLLIVRHGQSTANPNNIFAGHLDVPLTALGVKQAEATADYLASHYKIDAVYSSDLERAFRTARIVADRIGLDVHPRADLREVYAGEWEGKSFDYLVENGGEAYHKWRFDIGNAACTGGESCAALQARVLRAVQEIAKENDGKTVVIASHGGAIRALMCAVSGNTLDAMKDIPWVSNASVTTIIEDGGVLHLECAGYDEHLAGMKTVLAPNV